MFCYFTLFPVHFIYLISSVTSWVETPELWQQTDGCCIRDETLHFFIDLIYPPIRHKKRHKTIMWKKSWISALITDKVLHYSNRLQRGTFEHKAQTHQVSYQVFKWSWMQPSFIFQCQGQEVNHDIHKCVPLLLRQKWIALFAHQED